MHRPLVLALSAFALCLTMLGCTGASQSGGEAAPRFPADYQRVVTPDIAVQDSAGRSIANPFYGGLNTPRPQFVDIDGDGDEDLFLQERSGKIAFFAGSSDSVQFPAPDWPSPRRCGAGSARVAAWFHSPNLAPRHG